MLTCKLRITVTGKHCVHLFKELCSSAAALPLIASIKFFVENCIWYIAIYCYLYTISRPNKVSGIFHALIFNANK